MTAVRDDLVLLSDYAWNRLRDRLVGLTDAEYLWEPVPGCRTVGPAVLGGYRSDGPAGDDDPRQFTTLAWRLAHIVSLLQEGRNGPWLGQEVRPRDDDGDPGTAVAALAALDRAYAVWRSVLDGTTDESLAEPIGVVAGPYGKDTRRAFVLHVLDELIHHGAEAALMRDLYRASRLAK